MNFQSVGDTSINAKYIKITTTTLGRQGKAQVIYGGRLHAFLCDVLINRWNSQEVSVKMMNITGNGDGVKAWAVLSSSEISVYLLHTGDNYGNSVVKIDANVTATQVDTLPSEATEITVKDTTYLDSYPNLSSLASALGAMTLRTDLSIDTDIRTLPTGFWIIPMTNWGGIPALIPENRDGFLIKFKNGETSAIYIQVTTGPNLNFGIQWFSSNIVWAQVDSHAPPIVVCGN